MTGSLAVTLRRALSQSDARVAAVTLAALLTFAVVVPIVVPGWREMPNLGAGAEPPSWAHPFGTDTLSRDLFARVAYGGRISLAIAGLAALLSLSIGTGIGLMAGYAGGVVDTLLMRFVDAALAVPRLFILLLMLAAWDRVPLPAFIAVLGLTGWFGTSRLVRAEVLRVRAEPFVAAAKNLGAGAARTIFRHLLPNVLGVVLVSAALSIGEVILLEAGLSFLGVGVQPPTPSWGAMVLDGRDALTTTPWTILFPGVAILVTVLAVNVLADALRAAFDPRSA
ncbi:MAG: ABC transporter permease [Gemmatimonadetes bacterium]|nr:ABC transporter permease [Gemmatimonadota bacterium]